MGQKVNPTGLRIGIIEDWRSKWYADKNYATWLHEDLSIRKKIKKDLASTGISKVEIERAANKVKVSVHTAKPGIIIGKQGQGVEKLRDELQKLTPSNVLLNIVEVRKAELDAQLVAENVAQQMERRVSFRRAMKKAVSTTMRFGAKGIRINCAGRLGGAEMSRREWYLEGRVPLHTLRAEIDYGFAEARTTYGIIGVKVWIFKGEVLDKQPQTR
ncbi:MAG: small subunit ribosomal protein S3 [Bradymonadia bacterium]|jgi:small subunit ribosomal protein S3